MPSLKSKFLSSLAAAVLVLASQTPALGYNANFGEVGSLWGVVAGTKSNISMTVRGVANKTNAKLQASISDPRGLSRSLKTVSTNSDGKFVFKVQGLKWTSGIYKVTLKSGSVKQTLLVTVSGKRVRG
jgi:predicted NAD/FAD-binding protein